MNKELEHLKNCADLGELRSALHALCSRYGLIVRLDILLASQAGKQQALCFFRLESGEQEQQLMCELGVWRFGGDLVVIVELHAHESTTTLSTSAPLWPGLAHGYTQNRLNSTEGPFNA